MFRPFLGCQFTRTAKRMCLERLEYMPVACRFRIDLLPPPTFSQRCPLMVVRPIHSFDGKGPSIYEKNETKQARSRAKTSRKKRKAALHQRPRSHHYVIEVHLGSRERSNSLPHVPQGRRLVHDQEPQNTRVFNFM